MADRTSSASSWSGIPAALAAAAVAVVAASLVIAVFALTRGTAPGVLLRDPAAQFALPAYAGLLSYLGVALLCATSAITLFVGAVLREVRALFIYVGALSGLLAVDDLLLLHEAVGPDHLGIPELAFYALYAGLGLGALWLLVGQYGLRTGAGVLVSVGALGMSVAADIFVPQGGVVRLAGAAIPQIVIEDLLKLGGWAAWCGFWTALGFRVLAGKLAAQVQELR